MQLKDYQRLYDKILKMSYDIEEISLSNPTEEDIEKCKWIAAMHKVINDVPQGKTEYLLMQKKIKFDYIEFMNQQENNN